MLLVLPGNRVLKPLTELLNHAKYQLKPAFMLILFIIGDGQTRPHIVQLVLYVFDFRVNLLDDTR